ncbi:NACHT domain-containing protein [Streptomyces sp. NPDC002730]|uniref:NACHT domain-containing protein n=1 Tax=Streptomyces sp. NPDC002730 TaxID=3364662 RepID=UPI0036AF1A6B
MPGGRVVSVASEFSAVLMQLRVRAGMTQEDLAERSGLSVSTIRGLESGKRSNLRMATVQELADALALRPEDREELLSAAVPGDLVGDQYDDVPSALAVGQAVTKERRPENPGSGLVSGQPSSVAHDALSDATEQLARAVAAHWQREERRLQVQDPFPLPVRWQVTSEVLTDHWANIHRLPTGGTDGPLDLDGQLDGIAETYRRIPSRRLVVLGRSGSGKTVLALRFVLDHLKTRTPGEPVPVIFSIGAWNPATITLRDWLTDQLIRDHPALAARGPDGASLASALVESSLLLPVFDGFDEIADGLRRPALRALNASTLPLLLTSRPAEYISAVRETHPLASAAAIELTDLTLDDLAQYLPRTTRRADRANPAGAWEPVLAELGEQPPDGPAPPLATVLTTPLMVTLARSIYSDTPGRDPSELLDNQRFGSRKALEDHLLGNFIPTVYHHRPERGRAGRHRHGFTPERAGRWLGYLAQHLNQLETPDLAWWRLGTAMDRFSRMFALGLLTALVVGATTGLGNIAVDVIATSHGLGYVLKRGLVVALLHGLVAGLGSGILYGAVGCRRAAEPTRLRVQIFGSTRAMRTRFLPRFTLGLALGLLAALVLELVDQVAPAGLGLDDRLGSALVFMPGVGLGTGLMFGLMAWLEAPIDIRSAVSPADLLKTNRRYVVFSLLTWGLVFGLAAGLIKMFTAGSGFGLTAELATAFGLALGYWFSLTAWGQWIALARIWLPLTGRLPWALGAFLDDACGRGVLRQAGAVYQFRHARLQHHLGRTFGLVPDPVPRRPPDDLTAADDALSNSSAGSVLSRGGRARDVPSLDDLFASHAARVAGILDGASHELEEADPGTSSQIGTLDPDEAQRLAREAREAVNNDLIELFLKLGPPPEAANSDHYEPINSGGGGTRE